MADDDPGELIVLRCNTCGDTFTAPTAEGAACPSCGGADHQVAHEPLL